MNYRTYRAHSAKLLLALIASAALARAQATTTTTTTTTTPAATGGEVVKMEQFQVTDVPADQVILPTARPFASVFGTDDNIINVPRSVTIISREQMDTIGIQEVTDFSKLTASSYTDSNFGAPGNPSIRGQSADVFVNGMRQRATSNGNGAPLDFNAVDSVNIVKGPATAVQGASGYVGGFADMITKQPFFDGDHASVSDTIGSYATERWNLDIGGPLSPKAAYRFSYSGEYSNEWWNAAFKHMEAVYGAVTLRPSENYQIFINAKESAGKYSENFGINRPTQLLIDQGLYQSGININNGAGVPPSDSQNSKFIIGGFGSNTVAFGPLVPVNYHWRLQGPGSQSHEHEYNAQAVQTLTVNPDFKVVNNTFWSLTQRDTYGTHYYSEIIAPTWFIENRTEFIATMKALKNSVINAGLAEYYQHTLAYDDFFFEPANVWDLSKARSGMILDSVNFPLTFASAGNFPGGPVDVRVPGWPGRFASPSLPYNGDSNDSTIASVAPYAQATWHLTPMLNLITGARIDLMHVTVADPLTPNTKQSLSFTEPNLNGSLVYMISPTVSAYGTYNLSKNYTGALANGGGVTGWKTDSFGNFIDQLSRDNYEQPSQLYEVGLKTSLANNRLFFTSDLFQQTRQQKAQGQPATQEKFRGAEFEANYQPDKHFYATLAYSLLVGSLPAPAPFQAYSTNPVPNGPPSPFGPKQTTGKLRVPGYPLDTVTALLTYKFDNGFGFSANAVVTSPINNDYQGYLVIPWQKTIDGSVFYSWKTWSFKVGVTNLTNEHNWTPAYPTYGLEAIVPDPGFEFFTTVKYSF
jgi:catecholate siderophore receptor